MLLKLWSAPIELAPLSDPRARSLSFWPNCRSFLCFFWKMVDMAGVVEEPMLPGVAGISGRWRVVGLFWIGPFR